MRRTYTLAAIFAAVMLIAFGAVGYTQSPEMVINNPKAYADGKQRGPVTFTHDKHQGYGAKMECTTCHHKYDPKQPGKNLWEMGDETSCAACHAGAKKTAKLDMQQAFHKQCWGCHEKMPQDKKLAYGPRACAGCHKVK